MLGFLLTAAINSFHFPENPYIWTLGKYDYALKSVVLGVYDRINAKSALHSIGFNPLTFNSLEKVFKSGLNQHDGK